MKAQPDQRDVNRRGSLCRDIEALPRALAGQLAAPQPPRGLAGSRPGVAPFSQQKAAPAAVGSDVMVKVEHETPLAPSCHGEAVSQARHGACGAGRAPQDASASDTSEMPLRASAAELLLKLVRALPPRQASLEDSATCTNPSPTALQQQRQQQQHVDQQQEQQIQHQRTTDDACQGSPAQPGPNPSVDPETRAKRKWRTLASIYAACDMTMLLPEAEARLGGGGNKWQRQQHAVDAYSSPMSGQERCN